MEHALSAVVSPFSTVTAILYYGLHMLPALPQARLMNCISCDPPGFREPHHFLLKDHHWETIARQSGAIGFDCLSVVGQMPRSTNLQHGDASVVDVSVASQPNTWQKAEQSREAKNCQLEVGAAQERGQAGCRQALIPIKLRVAEGDY